MGDVRNADNIWVENPKRERPLARPMHTQEDNIKIYLKETECEGLDWIHMA
jgi:hypothetical protein